MIKIHITTPFLFWLSERLGVSLEEAEEFAQEFVTALHLYRGFPDAEEPSPDEPAQLEMFEPAS